jgi:hypothetical protein
VPAWETPLLSLHQMSADTLTRLAGAVGWALRVLQVEKAPLAEIERVLTRAMAGLECLSDEQAEQWKRVAWFLLLLVFHRREERELVDRVVEPAKQSKFREREEVAAMGLTVAEQLEATAELRSYRHMLCLLLEERFGPLPADLRQRIAGIDDLRRLQAALRQIAHVNSLAELQF